MLQILKKVEDNNLKVDLKGQLDSSNYQQLSAELEDISKRTKDITLNLEGLEYISSAGLRVLLATHQSQEKKGYHLYIENASQDIKYIFEITGFNDFLNILK